MRILLVEDDDVLRDGIMAGLGLEGFEVDAVDCLADARAAIGDHAGVLLDIGLPDGSGLDLLAEWRRAGVETPILLLTARNMVTDRVDGLERGADDYLGQPFDPTELSARPRATMSRPSGRARGRLARGPLALSEERRSVAGEGEEETENGK